MIDAIRDLGAGFWNIRGTFRLGGVINIGTQCSLVQLKSGKFIFLDSYTLDGDVKAQVMALTNDGKDVEAILNLHPFHTVHCEQMAADFPQATSYGSARHHEQVPAVTWSDDLVESDTVAARYPELKFSLPQGIYYISPNDKIHAGSLLAYHPASRSLHVDDTFITPPATLRKLPVISNVLPTISIHPTTKQALKNEADAAEQYCDWAAQLAEDWQDTRHFCAAHSERLQFAHGEFKPAMLTAVTKARAKLIDAE